MTIRRTIRACAAMIALGTTAACASGSGGTLGQVLGSVLGGAGGAGGQQQGQVQGAIRSVDTRNQQIALQLTNGQTVALGYDQQTQVVYQNRSYSVANLEPGDQVTATVQDNGNGNYYVSAVQVDQSVQGGGNTSGGTANGGSNSVQSVQGTVQQIDVQNGLFSIDVGNRSVYTVSLPYNVSRADSDRFRSLRQGDRVRFYGVLLNNTRIELRQFY